MKKNKYGFIFGVIFGSALLAAGVIFSKDISISIGAGVIAGSLVGWSKELKNSEEQDERTLKISGVAFRYSWFAIAITTGIFFLINSFAPGRLTTLQILSVISIVVLAVPVFLIWYFTKRGDVE